MHLVASRSGFQATRTLLEHAARCVRSVRSVRSARSLRSVQSARSAWPRRPARLAVVEAIGLAGRSRLLASVGHLLRRMGPTASGIGAGRMPELRAAPPAGMVWPVRQAVLIVNTRPRAGKRSPRRVSDLVDRLAAYAIQVDVRRHLSRSETTRAARTAAEAGARLVIAAGGDGTVEAVARGLIGTRAALGIIPLGANNRLASSLGIPSEIGAACQLIASSTPIAIDVGQVEAKAGRGSKNRRAFFQTAAIAATPAALTLASQRASRPAGPGASDASLDLATAGSLPGCPTRTVQVKLNGRAPIWVEAMLLTVSNAPAVAAGVQLAPEARLDDGLLDVCIYERVRPAASASGAGAVATPRRTQVVSVAIRGAGPLTVVADGRPVGVTPARFTVQPSALLACAGPGAAVTAAPVASSRLALPGRLAATEPGTTLGRLPRLRVARGVGRQVGVLGVALVAWGVRVAVRRVAAARSGRL